MDRFEEIKNRTYSTGRGDIFQLLDDLDWMEKEIERLRTVEQAYQALLSATAGKHK